MKMRIESIALFVSLCCILRSGFLCALLKQSDFSRNISSHLMQLLTIIRSTVAACESDLHSYLGRDDLWPVHVLEKTFYFFQPH